MYVFLVTHCVYFWVTYCVWGRVHDEFKSRPRNRKHVWWRPCCLEKTVHFAGTNESIPLLKRHENTKSYWETSSIYVSWNGRLSLHAFIFYTPATKLGHEKGILDSPCLSVCPSVCLLPFRVRPVASTVQDGFFPYLAQMINSMRGCVACDDLWPWPISSRSFGLDWENRVRSVTSTVLDGFFSYLAQMITIIRGCVACYVFFRIWKFEFLANFWNFSALTLKKNLQFSMDSFHI